MKLTVLGKYGPFPKVNGGTSSYLLQTKKENILLDCGSGAFARLNEFIKPEDLSAIVLSHLHHDHTADIGLFIYYFQSLFKSGYDKKLLVVCPQEGGVMLDEIKNCPYFTVVHSEEKTVNVGELNLEFYEMKHPVKSYGVLVKEKEKSFAYTGDTNVCDEVDTLFKTSDLILCDGGFLAKDWSENLPHLSVEKIVGFTKKYGNKSIISHINPKYTEEELLKAIENDKDKCFIAQEKETYEI